MNYVKQRFYFGAGCTSCSNAFDEFFGSSWERRIILFARLTLQNKSLYFNKKACKVVRGFVKISKCYITES